MSSSANKHAVPALAGRAEADHNAPVLLFATAFVLFLAIALVAQSLGQPWRSWLPGAEGVKSVTGGVKAAVYTFMSHLQ